jgi:hypothetical protein
MKLMYIEEPELEFGGGGKHVDIRFGLSSHGPLDAGCSTAPTIIRLGLIGTQETVEGIQGWLTKCAAGVPGKPTPLTHLFPSFPGYGEDACFRSKLVFGEATSKIISNTAIRELVTKDNMVAVAEGVDVFYDATRDLVEKGNVDVVVCALPIELMNLDADDDDLDDDDQPEQQFQTRLDLRHWLKAKAMTLNKPIQLVLPPTYDESKKRNLKTKPGEARRLQDEATRAWNFHTALYYKAGGVPWRIARASTDLTACHVGISFYKTLEENLLMTSMAQVYNERGEGVIVRGAPVRTTREEPQPHLTADAAYKLLFDALEKYRGEHRTLPARLVLHKTSFYNDAELDGFSRALTDLRIELYDFLNVSKTNTRLFRDGEYPPLRGTFLTLDAANHVLYTRGSVDFYSTYPGMYVPRPLRFKCVRHEQTPHFLAQELLALTKLNWNNTQFDGGEPITLRVAKRVGEVLKYVPDNQPVQPRYSFYM